MQTRLSVENAPCGGGGPVFFSGGDEKGEACKPPDTADLAPCGGCTEEHHVVTPDQLIKGKAKITDIDPEQSVVNRTVPVTIHGKGFTPDSVVTITGTGVTYSNPVIVSDKKITATFSVAANAAQGERDVFVTVNNVPTNSKKFKVQIPYKLRVVNDSGMVEWPNCTYIRFRRINYEFIDSDGDEIREPVHFKESFENQTNNSCQNGQPPPYPPSFSRFFSDFITITDQCSSQLARTNCRRNGSCGYEHIQKWLTWNTDGNIQLMSAPGITHCDEIRVDGSLQLPSGTPMPR